MKKIILALAVLLGISSCKIERDLSIVVQEMMNIENGLLVNDLGVKYSISDMSMASEILKQQRVFITGTAVQSDVAGYDYSLKPYEWYGVIIQECAMMSSAEDPDETWGTSPAELTHVWFQSGYINALVTVSFDSEEEYDGEVNMVFDDTRSSDSHLYFILKNKQEGKTWEDEDLTADKVAFGGQFYSFPYTQCYDQAFKGEQAVTIEWEWFKPGPYEGELPYRTVTDQQGNYTITVK
ncbi:MAG: hypothetical protein J6V81_08350 [Bacteroidales bacterium]|nr:hypothetical protein [Bacteroidales bacterium]